MFQVGYFTANSVIFCPSNEWTNQDIYPNHNRNLHNNNPHLCMCVYQCPCVQVRVCWYVVIHPGWIQTSQASITSKEFQFNNLHLNGSTLWNVQSITKLGAHTSVHSAVTHTRAQGHSCLILTGRWHTVQRRPELLHDAVSVPVFSVTATTAVYSGLSLKTVLAKRPRYIVHNQVNKKKQQHVAALITRSLQTGDLLNNKIH